jgi:site-specific DNA recombinase
MPIAIYCRVSTEEQRERQSIETQYELGQSFCKMQNLPVYRVYGDNGVSGTIPLDRRPEGSQIFRDARLGKFDELLVYKLDRLARDARLTLNAVAELEKIGVRVRSMTESFDTTSANGKLMMTMLAGFAAHEHSVIRERSLDGTNRVAHAGAWLGGIVPFGYRKAGEKATARLVVSEDPIPDMDISEADVVRLIYRMAAVERKSCFQIAAKLTELRVPCAYQRDERLVLKGKRKVRTSGLWRPGRVRNLIVTTTYKGIHEYGKRSRTKGRQTISRPVPAIVDAKTWERAQANLTAHQLFSRRSAKNDYLLRGLMKCGFCNLTYIGLANTRPNGKREFYYRCNGNQGARGIYGAHGERCPSKAVKGEALEEMVWSDILEFLRKPGAVIDRLKERMRDEVNDTGKNRDRLRRLRALLEGKSEERTKMVGLYRRGRLNDAELDQQMEEIDKDAAGLTTQIEELESKLGATESNDADLESAEALLTRLRKRLEQPLTFERKRQLVELLVGGIRVETIRDGAKRENVVTVTYRFSSAVDNCRDTRACNNCTFERVHMMEIRSKRAA